ncbi:MAG: hypothetical protein IPL28_24450 [Chloroflexi bacterium]|nr:hypothetical protein [Chloroflexota bacterium]
MAAIISASGATGHPKGVALSHYNLVANTFQTRHCVPTRITGRKLCSGSRAPPAQLRPDWRHECPSPSARTIVLLPVFRGATGPGAHPRIQRDHVPGVPMMYMAINQTRGARIPPVIGQGVYQRRGRVAR